MTNPHKATLEKANAAIRLGDIEGFLSHCTEDTEWTFVGDKVLRGKQAVREWMKAAYAEPPRFEVHRMIAEGDVVAALGEIVLEGEDGVASAHAYCDVWRFRDGRMAALQAFVIQDAAQRGS